MRSDENLCMPDIPITCHECNHQATVPLDFAGKRVRCLRCQTKLRVPERAAKANAHSRREASIRSSEQRANPSRTPGHIRSAGHSQSSTANRKPGIEADRSSALKILSDILKDSQHAVESVDYGFLIDIRGSVSVSDAKHLRKQIIAKCRGLEKVFIAGGDGAIRLTAIFAGTCSREGLEFADENEETAVFHRAVPKADENQALDVDAIVAHATAGQIGLDPVQRLIDDAAPYDMSESLVPVVPEGSIASRVQAPDSIEVLVTQGTKLADQGKFPEAIRLLERAVRTDKSHPEAVNHLARIYAQTGEYERSRRAFRLLAKIKPKDPEAHVMHAAAALKCDRLEDARHSLVAAIKLDSNHKSAYRYASKLYQKLGDPIKARQFQEVYRKL